MYVYKVGASLSPNLLHIILSYLRRHSHAFQEKRVCCDFPQDILASQDSGKEGFKKEEIPNKIHYGFLKQPRGLCIVKGPESIKQLTRPKLLPPPPF